jgi:tetratricopeptide (TPR) repeat protein
MRLSHQDGGTMNTPTISMPYLSARETAYVPAGWKTLPPQNANFTGRDAILDQLRSMLVNSAQTAILRPRVLYGFGGVGKTQLAIEYAHRHRFDYDLIWWIAAEDSAEMRRSLLELARLLEIPVAGETHSIIRQVHESLALRERFPRWLLVFDNVGDPAGVAPLLPSSRTGHVLITSRHADWEEHGQAVQVDKFDRVESIALLQRHSDLSTADAGAVAARLGDLPISLAQAAAWHAETRQPVADYLTLLEEELHRRVATPSLGYPRSAEAAMSLAFQQVRKHSPDAAELLELASYFGPEWISLDLLHRGRYATPLAQRLNRKSLRDQASLKRAVQDIARWEIARNDTRRSRFRIHRLMQLMVQEDMDPGLREEVRETVRTMLAVANPGDPDCIAPREQVKHAELSAHLIPSGIIESGDDNARRVVVDQIRYRYLTGDHKGSRDLADRVRSVWEPRFGADDELTLIARRHQANAIAALGDPASALAIDREVLDRFEARLGMNHEHTMTTVSSVCADLRALGRFEEAKRLSEDNHQRHVRKFGADDRATLLTANNFAVDLRMVGEYPDALALDEQTLATAHRTLGPEDRLTLLLSRNVAHDLLALGRYPEALARQQSDLPLYEQVLGADHPAVLLARQAAVIGLRKLGRTRQAAEEARPLSADFRSRFGDDHPAMWLMEQTRANSLRDNGELIAAREIGEQSLSRYRNRLPDHPYTAVCATNLAVTYRQAGRLAEARRLNATALDQLATSLGRDHHYWLSCAVNLANDQAAAGDREAARRLSAEVLERSQRVRGPEHPDTLACAVNHALDLAATGDTIGLSLRFRTIDIMETSPAFGPAHPHLALARDGKRIDCDIEAPPT